MAFFVKASKRPEGKRTSKPRRRPSWPWPTTRLHFNHADDTNAFDCREWYARRALELFRQIGDREGMADSMMMLAGQLEYQDAIRLLEDAITLAREGGSPKGVAMGMIRLGQHMLINGDEQSGRQLVRDALPIARGSGQSRLLAFALFANGVASDGVESLAFYEEAISLYRAPGHECHLAETLQFAAMRYAHTGQTLQEERCVEEALAIYQRLDNPFNEAFCLRDLARMARRAAIERAESLEAQCRVDLESQFPPSTWARISSAPITIPSWTGSRKALG